MSIRHDTLPTWVTCGDDLPLLWFLDQNVAIHWSHTVAWSTMELLCLVTIMEFVGIVSPYCELADNQVITCNKYSFHFLDLKEF